MDKINFDMKKCLEDFGKLSIAHRVMIRDAGLDPAGKNVTWYNANREMLAYRRGDKIKETQIAYLLAMVNNPNLDISSLTYTEARRMIRQVSALLPPEARDEVYLAECRRLDAKSKRKAPHLTEPVVAEPPEPDEDSDGFNATANTEEYLKIISDLEIYFKDNPISS